MNKYINIVLLLLITVNSNAQRNANAISLSFGGGQNKLAYESANGVTNAGYGWNTTVEFHHYFSSQMGIATGLELQSFSSSTALSFTEETPDVDVEGDIYVFKTRFDNWKEQQQLLNLEIPVTVFYQFPLNEKFQLQATLGAKICLPVSSCYKTTGGEMITSAYYPSWDVELNNLPQYGYDTFTNEFKGTYKAKVSIVGIAEIGGLYKLTEKFDLYAGVYYNYGFNNMLESVDKNVYQIDAVYNGVLNSYQTNEVKLMAIGLKMGLIFKI